jgi:serine/threonine protein phosphatase 1
MKTFVIGDIHGGYKSLVQCLARSNFNKDQDTLISLGDIADGWSQVPECVEELLTIKNLIAIEGNHDNWARQWLKFRIANTMWLNQGGQATFDAYSIYYPDLMIKHEKEFFSKQVPYYVDNENRGFVHGGFVSRLGLGHDITSTNYMWDRDLWSLAMLSNSNTHYDEDGLPSSQRFFRHKEVFIGHTTTGMWHCKPHFPEFTDDRQESKNGRIVIPMNRCNVWNLDTGGGYEGKLTIMDIDTKEYWQSDFLKTLYTNEIGR